MGNNHVLTHICPCEIDQDDTTPTLDHIIVTLGNSDFQGLWRQFTLPPQPESKKEQGCPPNPPPPDGASLTHTTSWLKIHRAATSAVVNYQQVCHAATPYESRSQLTIIPINLVAPICYSYTHVTTHELFLID
jgi:hypothetical protein